MQRYWDGRMWTQHTVAPNPGSGPPASRGVQIGGVIMALIVPGIGLFVGLIMLVKREVSTALAMFAASALSFFCWLVFVPWIGSYSG